MRHQHKYDWRKDVWTGGGWWKTCKFVDVFKAWWPTYRMFSAPAAPLLSPWQWSHVGGERKGEERRRCPPHIQKSNRWIDFNEPPCSELLSGLGCSLTARKDACGNLSHPHHCAGMRIQHPWRRQQTQKPVDHFPQKSFGNHTGCADRSLFKQRPGPCALSALPLSIHQLCAARARRWRSRTGSGGSLSGPARSAVNFPLPRPAVDWGARRQTHIWMRAEPTCPSSTFGQCTSGCGWAASVLLQAPGGNGVTGGGGSFNPGGEGFSPTLISCSFTSSDS